MSLLPEPSLWDSVGTDKPVERRRWLYRSFCKHANKTRFTHVDHRAGPGSFADSWHGHVCVDCGEITDRLDAWSSPHQEQWPLAHGPEERS